MNNYLRQIFTYFENVIHPASGWSDHQDKRKRRSIRLNELQSSPESFNIRGGNLKKQEKLRRSPAP